MFNKEIIVYSYTLIPLALFCYSILHPSLIGSYDAHGKAYSDQLALVSSMMSPRALFYTTLAFQECIPGVKQKYYSCRPKINSY